MSLCHREVDTDGERQGRETKTRRHREVDHRRLTREMTKTWRHREVDTDEEWQGRDTVMETYLSRYRQGLTRERDKDTETCRSDKGERKTRRHLSLSLVSPSLYLPLTREISKTLTLSLRYSRSLYKGETMSQRLREGERGCTVGD